MPKFFLRNPYKRLQLIKKYISKIILLLIVAGLSFTVLPEVIPEIKEVVPVLYKSDKKEVPLKTYTGVYVFNELIKAKITFKDDKLFVIQLENKVSPLELIPDSTTKFKVKGLEDSFIEFKHNNNNNNVIGLNYIREGQEMSAVKYNHSDLDNN